MNIVVTQNKMQFTITKINAAFGLIIPVGISLFFVRWFFLSYSRSIYLLKLIAALRAKTMHNITKNKVIHGNPFISDSYHARKKPIKAKGMAKIV
jgi:hypothetical protein